MPKSIEGPSRESEQNSDAHPLEGAPSFAEHIVERLDQNKRLNEAEQNAVREKALEIALDIDDKSRFSLDAAAGIKNLPIEKQDRILDQEIAIESYADRLIADMASDISTVSSIVGKLQKNFETFQKEFRLEQDAEDDTGEEDTGFEGTEDMMDEFAGSGGENSNSGETTPRSTYAERGKKVNLVYGKPDSAPDEYIEPKDPDGSIQDQLSPENDYSQDRGGAHADEYAPVQADEEAQAAANAAEIPIEQAPTGGQALDNVLKDLGIN